jgi:hypothetical protein
MCRALYTVREATAFIPNGAKLPEDLLSLTGSAPGHAILPEVVAADLSTSNPVPYHGYCFRLLRSQDPESRILGVLATPSGSSLTFKDMFLWTGNTHVKARYKGISPSVLPSDAERRNDWSTWCN